MERAWYRSRLCWLCLLCILLFLSAWITPQITKEGRYIGARWIAPGDFYQGFGLSLGFHRVALWLGGPYAGFANPFRETGSSNVAIPFDSERHSWSEKDVIPIRFKWGSPSPESFSVAIDYWFGVALCSAIFVWRLITRGRFKRMEADR